MGYTHYWRKNERDFTKAEFKTVVEFTKLAIEMIETEGVVIRDGFGEKTPNVDVDLICFNGDGSEDLDHETFALEPVVAEFKLCKTDAKPYDTLVTAILLFCKQTYPDVLTVTSDGDMEGEDWSEGKKLLEAVEKKKIRGFFF